MKYNRYLEDMCSRYCFDALKEGVAAYKASNPGKKVIDLGVGDVCLPLPHAVGSAMSRASIELCGKETFRGYPPGSGYSFLKRKIAEEYAADGISLEEEEIFISDGTKSDLSRICDLFGKVSVALPSPCYPAVRDVNLSVGNDVYEFCAGKENDFTPSPPYGKRYDVVWLCSPNNPTGGAFSFDAVRKWVDYALSCGAVIVYDGAYADYLSDRYPKSVYKDPRAKRCAIELRSFSKGAAFTGVRCGYAVVPQAMGEYNRLMRRNIGCKFNGVSYVTQRGAEATFLPEARRVYRGYIDFYKTNAEIVKNAFKNKNLWYNICDDSPYVFAEIPKKLSSADFCGKLLAGRGVVATPGNGFGFGGEGFIRLSAFCSREEAFEASDALDSFLNNL